MIHAWAGTDPAVLRILDWLRARGHEIGTAAAPEPDTSSTLVLAGGQDHDPLALGVLLGAWRYARGARVLVLSRLGSHPDAQARSLRALWELEERARETGLRCMTVRLAPMLGPHAPLWLKLRSAPRLPKRGRSVIQPVLEEDVVTTLDRLLQDSDAEAPWEGWFEVAGPEPLSLAELAGLAAAAGPKQASQGAWEPPLEEMMEHRLAEPARWFERFGTAPGTVREAAPAWA